MPKVAALWESIGTLKAPALALSLLTVALIVGVRALRPKWPAFLIAVAAASLVHVALGLDVATIGTRFGEMPRHPPAPALPSFDLAKLQAVFPDAIAIALLGSIESLLSAVVADGMTGRRHRSNCELVAQGTANIAAVLFGGMCATGTIARTATNIRAGARGPVSGILHALFVLLFMLFLAPLAAHIPLACLGAVLAVVAWNMAEKHEFAGLLRSSWGDATVLTVTFLLTVFADLTIAIGVGVTLSAFLFLHRMAETVEVQTGTRLVAEDVADTANGEREAYEPAAPGARILVYRISGAFFFGATAAVSSVLDRIGGRPEAFVLDFTNVPLVDSTAANALAGFVRSLRNSGTQVYFAGTSNTVRGMLMRAGLGEPLVRYELTAQAAEAHWRAGSRP